MDFELSDMDWQTETHRSVVLQATGMVSVQAHCACPAALVMMRDRGLVQHLSLTEVARRVVDREIQFGDAST